MVHCRGRGARAGCAAVASEAFEPIGEPRGGFANGIFTPSAPTSPERERDPAPLELGPTPLERGYA